MERGVQALRTKGWSTNRPRLHLNQNLSQLHPLLQCLLQRLGKFSVKGHAGLKVSSPEVWKGDSQFPFSSPGAVKEEVENGGRDQGHCKDCENKCCRHAAPSDR